MKKEISHQIPVKSRVSLGNTFDNLYPNKLENLEEMNKNLNAFDLPQLNQEDINYLN
jgi:hypothetical protein